MKKSIKYNSIVLSAVLFIILLCCIFVYSPLEVALAESSPTDIMSICQEYTENVLFKDEDGNTQSIFDYENYLKTKFTKSFESTNLADEWLFNIVPKQLFDQHVQNFFYIGQAYGFFVNYNSDSNNYLVYLILNELDFTISGQLIQTIRPIYYEQYIYDSINGTASLVPKTETRYVDGEPITVYSYQHYSDIKKLYLKNFLFSGTIMNENHLNIGEEGYINTKDMGAFFTGVNYKFKGVTTQHGKLDLAKTVFSTVLGYIPVVGKTMEAVKAIGDFAIDAIEIITAAQNWEETQKNDFRDVLSNEGDYPLRMEENDALTQITKFGNLLRNYASIMQTSSVADGVMYGIGGQCYVQNTFHYNFANTYDKWNSIFIGKINLDIVEESNTLDGSTVKVIAENVESNGYYKHIYKDEKIKLQENAATDVYTLPQGECNFELVAPANGNYQIETFGTIKNFITVGQAQGQYNSDNINQTLNINAKNEQSIQISVKSLVKGMGKFSIKITFMPSELKIDKKQTISIKPGESEYFVINVDKTVGYSLSIQSLQEVGFLIDYANVGNSYKNYQLGKDIKSGFILELKGRYFLKVFNNNTSAVSVNITLSYPSAIKLCTSYNFNQLEEIYQFVPTYTSSYNFVFSNAKNISTYLFDDNFQLLLHKQGSNFSMSYSMIGTRKYFVMVEAESIGQTNFNIVPIPKSISFGDTNLTKSTNNVLYQLENKNTELRLNISAGTNTISVFDSNMKELANNSILKKGEKYFIGVAGQSNNFTISAKPVVSGIDGVFPSDGFVFVKYIPKKDGEYEVTGNQNVKWYNEQLVLVNAILKTNQVYYLKVEGSYRKKYNINISFKAPLILLNTHQNIKQGYYKLNLTTEKDVYAIRTYCENGANATLTLYNSDQVLINSNINANQVAFKKELSKGIYYLNVSVYNASDTTINILQSNPSTSEIITLPESLNSQILDFSQPQGKLFCFKCNKDATYYLEFGTTYNTDFKITVYNNTLTENLNAIKVDKFDKSYDTLAYKYAFSLKMTKGESYYISVNCLTQNEKNSSIRLIVPAKIQQITLGNMQTLKSSGIAQDDLHAIMGTSYKIVITSNLDATARDFDLVISPTANPENIASLANNYLNIGVNASALDRLVTLKALDDYADITVTLSIKYPYYAKATLDSNYIYKVSVIDSYNRAVSEDNFVSMDVTCGSIHYDSKEKSVDVIRAQVFDNTSINAIVTFKAGGIDYNIEIANISYPVKKYTLANFTTSDASKYARIVIDSTNDKALQNKTISIPANVKAVFFKGSINQIFEKLSIDYNGEDKGYICTNNIYIESPYSSFVINSSRNNVDWLIVNETKIYGTSSTALVVFKNITLLGAGTLTIVGADGKDGGVGVSGGHGTTAFMCDSMYVQMNNGTLKLQGGKGGNGGAGSNGANGTTNSANGSNGKNGGAGGNGGHAIKCTNNVNIKKGRYYLYGGNGGNGGQGGIGGDGLPGYRLTGQNVAPGGNGGNGGQGGNGGNAGVSGYLQHLKPEPLNLSISKNGFAGWGGDGGEGGYGGRGIDAQPGHGQGGVLFYTDASNGGNGGNGGNAGNNGVGTLDIPENSTLMINVGGNGGNGGDGGHGNWSKDNGDIGVAGNGGKGGNGGNGYVGGSAGCGGYGGNGGNGQPGGTGGKAGLVGIGSSSVCGLAGENGKDGAHGPDIPKKECIASGTLITLASGRQVPVESLKGDELLLVWNLYTGRFDIAPILFIDSDPAQKYEIINLYFSDGTSVKVISEHAFWDCDLNKYVFLRADAAKYIGHWFNKQTTNSNGKIEWTKVQLINVELTTEITIAWSPVTYGHLCYYVNGMLSMPGATESFINIFDVDAETMKIDEAAFEQDIETYGLFTYEEFAELLPIPEVIFEAFGGQYLKVAIGKGLTTMEELATLIQRYEKFFN